MPIQESPRCAPGYPRQQKILIEEINAQLRDMVQDLVEYLRPPANPGKRISTRIEHGTEGGLKVEISRKMRRLSIYDFFAAWIDHRDKSGDEILFQTSWENYPFPVYQTCR